MILRRPGGRLLAVWTLTGILILLAVPVGLRTSAAITGLAFLVEFLTEGQHPWLSRMTEAPVVEALPGPDGEDLRPDLWRPGGRHRVPWPGLVLVHGLTPEGKRDGRLAWTAARLARAGFAVAVPDLPALRAQRLRPEDALIVRETLVRLAAHPAVQPGPVVMLTVSVGLAPAALALAEPGQAERVRLLVALGGHADARELIRYFTTGAYGFGPAAGRVGVEPSLSTAFLARNLDLVPDARDRTAVADALRGQPLSPDAGPGARAVLALLQNRDPARVDALLDNLPAETRALLDALSPARHVRSGWPRLILVHGRNDPAIPFTESARLAAATGDRARVVAVELIDHVEGARPTWRRLVDLLRLWSVSYELLAG